MRRLASRYALLGPIGGHRGTERFSEFVCRDVSPLGLNGVGTSQLAVPLVRNGCLDTNLNCLQPCWHFDHSILWSPDLRPEEQSILAEKSSNCSSWYLRTCSLLGLILSVCLSAFRKALLIFCCSQAPMDRLEARTGSLCTRCFGVVQWVSPVKVGGGNVCPQSDYLAVSGRGVLFFLGLELCV